MSGFVTIFDRYLLKRYCHVFAIGFLATYGLYVVFDAFTNADEFQMRTAGQGTGMMVWRMTQHYFLQAFPMLDLVGPILVVVSAMAVFALLQRQSEVYPILSAGVPAWRLAVPILVGSLGVLLLLTANQELVIPQIANRLQSPRGTDKAAPQAGQIARDYVTNVEISGRDLYLAERRIEKAEFLLPVPSLVAEPTILHAREAIQVPASGKRPAGWLLRDVSPAYQRITLTEHGREYLHQAPEGTDVFLVSDVTIDQLHNRSASYRYLSTAELIQRIRNPAFGLVSIRSQSLHLHERLTRPLLVLISVIVAIPLTMRKESRELLLNLATGCAVLGGLYLITQASLSLGGLNVVPIDVAAWFPVVLCGSIGAMLSGLVQT